jgi:hypothetical protein
VIEGLDGSEEFNSFVKRDPDIGALLLECSAGGVAVCRGMNE